MATDRKPIRDPDPAATSLPLPPQPAFAHPYPLQGNFSGRVRERKALTDWLAQGEQPICALIAIGGMGKTALAWVWLQHDVLGLPLPGLSSNTTDSDGCHLPASGRPDGVLWWSFYEREAGFARFVDHALYYTTGGDKTTSPAPSLYDKMQRLLAALHARRFLLVLDGFERELRAYASLFAAYQGDTINNSDTYAQPNACSDPHTAAFLRSLAQTPLRSRVLLTSRLLPRELDGSPMCQHLELTALDPADAVSFLKAEGMRGSDSEIQAACERYGYHPLALRLLAGMVTCDPNRPGDIGAASASAPLPLLARKDQDILALSYDALRPPLRNLLSCLAAFRSAMDEQAIKALGVIRSDRDLQAALRELVARQLLLFSPHSGRYDLHPSVRQYAYDRLSDKMGIHSRLRDYFKAVPTRDEDQVTTVDDLSPVIELYHHTIRANCYDEAYQLMSDRLARPLYYRLGLYETCIELLRALFPDGEKQLPRLRSDAAQAWTLNTLGLAYSRSGQPLRSLPLFEASNAIAVRYGDRQNLAIGLGNLAYDQSLLGQLKAAEANLQRRVELAREAGDRFREAVGHQELGRLRIYMGSSEDAEKELAIALGVFAEMGAKQSQSVVQSYRSLLALLQADPAHALAAARRARQLADEATQTGFPYERDIVRAKWLLGAALLAQVAELSQTAPRTPDGARSILALIDESEQHLTDALTRCRRINLLELEPDILLTWAQWHDARGDHEKAKQQAQEALTIADRYQYRLKQAEINCFLASLILGEGDEVLAWRYIDAARERAWCDGPPYCYGAVLDEVNRLVRRTL